MFSSSNTFYSTSHHHSKVALTAPRRLMAVGGGAPNKPNNVIISDDNGLTWSINTSGCQALLTGGFGNAGTDVIYDFKKSTWIASIGCNYMYSKDNANSWTTDVSVSIACYTYKTNGEIYLMFGYDNNNKIMYSYDGMNNWTNTNASIFFTKNAYTAIYNGAKWIVVGNGSKNILTSTDGITWVYNGTGGDALLTQGFCIAYNFSTTNPIYLAGGEKGAETMIYSIDCINWVKTTNATSFTQEVYGIGYNGTNQWVAIGVALDTTGVVMYSSDGMYWVKSNSGSNFMNGYLTSNSNDINNYTDTKALGTVLWNNGSWFVGGCSTTANIIKSTDGINWTVSDNTFNVAGYGCSSIASS